MIKPLSIRERKTITSLKLAKRRKEEGLFIAEGVKTIQLLLKTFAPRWIVISEDFPNLIERYSESHPTLLRIASPQVMKTISQLESRQDVIAVFEHKKEFHSTLLSGEGKIAVALDAIQNPGNMGTIIRLCDWLGIPTLILGEGCTDPFGAKAVQASMGALANVSIIQDVELYTYLPKHYKKIIATTMDGEDYRAYKSDDVKDSVLLFGNEGNGISSQLLSVATHQVTIPKAIGAVSESLNVSLSAAILLSSFVQ